MWNVIRYSPGIQLQELKEIAKQTSMRAGCHISIQKCNLGQNIQFCYHCYSNVEL
jgi:hypothetical protein